MESLYKKCDNCGEKHWETEPCAKEYEVYETGCFCNIKTVREWSFARAAEKYAKKFGNFGNGDTINFTVEKNGEIREYEVTMNITIEYETKRIDEI